MHSEELITSFDPFKEDVVYPGSNKTLPTARLLIELSDTRNIYTREPYTAFALLGDFGGFNGAIIMFPALLMSFYTPRMYAAAVAHDTPVREPRSRNSKQKQHQLTAQTNIALESAHSPTGLNEGAVGSLIKQARNITRPKISFAQLMCFTTCICNKGKTKRLIDKINDRFEEQLDVRSLVRVRTNLALLLRLMFTDQQLLLYRHQRRRSISIA